MAIPKADNLIAASAKQALNKLLKLTPESQKNQFT